MKITEFKGKKNKRYNEMYQNCDFNELIKEFEEEYIDLYKDILKRDKIKFDNDGTFEAFTAIMIKNYDYLEDSLISLKGLMLEEDVSANVIVEYMVDTYSFVKAYFVKSMKK